MRTILIIDDDPTILGLLAAYLGQRGFQPLEASDGRTGLEVFERERPDAVLCDLAMPGLDGLAVLAEVKRRCPLTPFIVISGTTDLTLAVEALRLGAWDFVLKPLPSLELLDPLLARMEERVLLLREKEQSQRRLEEQIQARTAQLTRQLHEKDLLLSEVHHRVKNTLQVLLVLLGLEQDHSGDPGVRRVLDRIRERIHVLALVQEEMHAPDRATAVGARDYGTGLVHHLLSAHGLTDRVDLRLDLEDLSLGPDLAFTWGLVMNELTAALAAGGPAREPWRLEVRLRAPGGRAVELTVSDSRGTLGAWVPAPGRPSVGWDLVSALAVPGGGSLDWDPGPPGTVRIRLR